MGETKDFDIIDTICYIVILTVMACMILIKKLKQHKKRFILLKQPILHM